MKFRLRIFSWHLLSSVSVLTLVLGGMYLGWYRWPGWYLTDALKVAPILAGVDLALGPLLTLLVANPNKARRELVRDIAIIVTAQLLALGYGVATLWQGRPLYYAFSEDRLQLVQASDLGSPEKALALKQNPDFAAHWYSRPRWVWAPLPAAESERSAIINSARSGGDDVIQMPRYFKSWEQGLPRLREHLQTVEQQADIRLYKKKRQLRERMVQHGFAPEAAVTMILTGRTSPLLAVFDGDTLRIRALLRSDFRLFDDGSSAR